MLSRSVCKTSRAQLVGRHAQTRSLRVTPVRSRRLVVVSYIDECDPADKCSWLKLPKEANYSVVAKDHVLTHAEEELGHFCSRISDPSKAKDCWDTYQFLKDKHLSSLKGCTREVSSGAPAANCAQLEKLDQMIRELEAGGQVETLYSVLALMRRMESDPQFAKDAHTSCSIDSEQARLQKEAEDLFVRADTNRDGKIDVAEFRNAMAMMTKELSGDEVAEILGCLDIHGFIEKDDFIDIVLAEQTRVTNPDADAEFLKHIMHRHGHEHHAVPFLGN